jgi:hypothetical protein
LLNYDDASLVVREYWFSKDYKKGRKLCKYILNELPKHIDWRMLIRGMYTWNGEYKEVEFEL